MCVIIVCIMSATKHIFCEYFHCSNNNNNVYSKSNIQTMTCMSHGI